jgi:hypothetical protein
MYRVDNDVKASLAVTVSQEGVKCVGCGDKHPPLSREKVEEEKDVVVCIITWQ